MKRLLPPVLLSGLIIVCGVAAFKLVWPNSVTEPTGIETSVRDLAPALQVPTEEVEPSPSLRPIPQSKVLAGSHTFQTFNNCGPSALSMALSYYGLTVSQQTLGQALRPYQNPQGDNDDKSVTLAELSAKAQEYEFITYHRPAGSMEILKRLVALDLPVITRTWLESGEDIGHYRVVKGYDEGTGELVQDDSLQGKDLRYSYDEFNELWQAFNYEFLVLVPPEKQTEVEMILGDLVDENQAWVEALKLAEQQLAEQPNDMYAQFNRSVALYYLQRYGEAIVSFELVRSRLPNRMLWYQIEPLLAYYQTQDYPTVLRMSDQILNNQNRAFSELHYLRGLIYQTQNQSARASEAFADAERYNQGEFWKENL